MKAVTLAVLLVLLIFAVACIFTGAPAESGKLRYGHETCLVVILQALKCNYIDVFLLNYELLHDDGLGNAEKIPGILNIGFKCRSQDSVHVLLKKLRGLDVGVFVVRFPVLTRYSLCNRSLVCLTTYP